MVRDGFPAGCRAETLGVAPISNPGRILAVDYGRRKIGLALSDELRLTAQPLVALLRVNRRSDLRRLSQICREHSVVRIIVGHPLHLRGEAGEMAAEAARFAAKLRKEIGIVTELVDERLTSWEAERIVAQTHSSRRRDRRRPLDDLAAAVLLRDYLERKRQTPAAQPEKD
jgi:putative holliday junction resolvase